MAASRRWKRPGWGEAVAFLALMTGLQLAGSLLLPDRWTGAQGLLQIVGTSVVSTAIYVVLMRVLLRSAESRPGSEER